MAELSSAAALRALSEAAQALNATLSESGVVETLLKMTIKALQAEAALLRLLDRNGEQLRLVGSVGLGEAYRRNERIRVADSAVDQRVLQGDVVRVPDIEQAEGFPFGEAAQQAGLHAALVVPVVVRGRVTGVLRVFVAEVEAVGEAEQALVEAIAALGALAIEKVRIHDSLFRLADALNSSLELRFMLEKVLQTTVTDLGLKAAAIRLLDQKHQVLELAAAVGLSEAYLQKGAVQVARSALDQRVLKGEEVVLVDVAADEGFQYPEQAREEGIQSVLVVPLVLQDQTVGVLRAYSAMPRQFGPVATTFLTSVAGLVAAAIEKAQLYEALRAKYADAQLDLAEWRRFLALG